MNNANLIKTKRILNNIMVVLVIVVFIGAVPHTLSSLFEEWNSEMMSGISIIKENRA